MRPVVRKIDLSNAISLSISVLTVISFAFTFDLLASNPDPAESLDETPQTYMAPPGVREEDIVVIEDYDPEDQYEMIRRGYADQQRGIYLYNRKDYAKAYPFLLVAAQLGFKEAQARVGAIHLYRLGGIQRQHHRGMGWMAAAAASGKTNPVIKRFYEDLWNNVPEEHIETLRVVVTRYIEKFGSEKLAIISRTVRHASTHVARLRCYFDDEETFKFILDSAVYNEYYDKLIEPPDQFDSFNTPPSSGAQDTDSTSAGSDN